MKYFQNEVLLLESDDKSILLTTHRIRQQNKHWGKLQMKSIMLEHVSACEYARKSNPLYLILGVIAIGFGLVVGASGHHDAGGILILSLAVGIGFLVVYSITIRKGLLISSSSSRILVNTNSMKDESIIAFVDKLEEAKSILN